MKKVRTIAPEPTPVFMSKEDLTALRIGFMVVLGALLGLVIFVKSLL